MTTIIQTNDGEQIGELHINTNKDGISIIFVVNGNIVKSTWLTIDDIFELMR